MKRTLLLLRVGAMTPQQDESPFGPLSSKGRRRVGVLLNGLWRSGTRVDRMVHAETSAATESAAILAPLVHGSPSPSPLLMRTPDEHLLPLLDADVVAMVGHQPWLGEIAAWLVIGQRTRGDLLKIGRSAVVVLRGRPEPGGMQLREIWSNKVLRALAGRGK